VSWTYSSPNVIASWGCEVANLGASPLVDVFKTGVGTGSPNSTGTSPASVHASAFVLAGMSDYNGTSAAPSTSWVNTDLGIASHLSIGWEIQSSSGLTYIWSQTTGGTVGWAGFVISLYAASTVGAGLSVPALYDDFNTPSTLSSKWGGSSGSGVSVSGGLATLNYPASGSVTLKSGTPGPYDLTGSYYQVKANPQIRASTLTALQVNNGASNYFEIHYDGANLVGIYEAAGSPTTVGTIAYSATNHAWWRIREVNGVVYYDVSADGLSWTNLWSTAYAIAVTSMTVQCYAKDNGSGLSGTSTFANFNTNAAVPSPAALVGVTTGLMVAPLLTAPLCGPRSVTPNNAQGNLLLVLAAWNNLSAYVPTPAGAVADSQGNWWRYVGDSGQVGTGIRVGAFVCSNALAVSNWLSFCPQGYTGAFAFQVIELSGLPASYWPLLDFHVAGATGGGSLSVTGVTQQADYVFAVAANQWLTNTITGPASAGWTALGSVSGGSECSIIMDSAYGTYAPGTSVTAAWTVGTTITSNSAALMVGISMASALPAQSRSTFPRVLVDCAFGTNPGDSTAAITDDLWVSASNYALGKQGQVNITSSRGQQYELATPEAGQMTIAMNNQAGDFNPQWAGSVFYSNAVNPDPAMQLLGTAGWSVTSGSAQLGMTAAQSFASGLGCYADQSLGITPSSGAVIGVQYAYSGATNVNYKCTGSLWVMFPAGWSGGNTELQLEATTLGGSTTVIGSQTLASVPAGTWTQLSATGTVPADLASLSALLTVAGTPTQEFFVAEVGFVTGSSPMLTGLVRLGVPVRTSCFWNGRRYPVGYGYVERWPQDWPDFPQWGWSNLVATDVVGVAASVNLPSAVQGEILADLPYLCLPFSEQYTAPDATIPLSGVDGMFAGNTALSNVRPATYTNGSVTPVVTGQTVGTLGDAGTGMGNSEDTSLSTLIGNGPGAVYGPDPSMPSVPCAFEFWVAVDNVSAPPASTHNVKLFSVNFPPDPTSQSLGIGVLCLVGVQFTTANDLPTLWIATNSTALTLVGTLTANNYSINGTVFEVASSLVHLEVGTSTIKISINDGTAVSVGYSATPGGPLAVVFGEAAYVTGNYYYTYAYSMAYGTMYPGSIPLWRIACHSFSGLSGFGQDGVTDRALRYVAWAGLNLGLAGQQDTASQLGPAYSTAGSSLASAINNDAQSFAARWGGISNGNLVIQTRQAQSNQTPLTTFGDAPAGPLNANWNFLSGLTGWSAARCTASIVTSTRFTFSQSCLLTFNGTSAGPQLFMNSGAQIPVLPSTGYELLAWLMSPAGWYGGAGVAIDWYNSSNAYLSTTGGPTVLPPGVWVPANPVGNAPATAAYGFAYVFVDGTPPTTTQVYVDQASLRLEYDQVTYQPKQAMDFDNTYVSNVVKASITEGTITTATPTVRSQSSVLQYFQRGPLQQQVSGTTSGDAYDRANWSLSKYQQPSMRVRAITVDSASRPATFSQVLRTDIGDTAYTVRSPLGQTRYNLPVVTQRVETHIGPGVWTTDYQQSPYVPEGTVLQADVASRDSVSSNALAW
jgi:hypothetical protein